MENKSISEEYYILDTPLDYEIVQDSNGIKLIEDLPNSTFDDNEVDYADLRNINIQQIGENDIQFDSNLFAKQSFHDESKLNLDISTENSNLTNYNAFNVCHPPYNKTPPHMSLETTGSLSNYSRNIVQSIQPHYGLQISAEGSVPCQSQTFMYAPYSLAPRAPFQTVRRRGRPPSRPYMLQSYGSRGLTPQNFNRLKTQAPNRDSNLNWLLDFRVEGIFDKAPTQTVKSQQKPGRTQFETTGNSSDSESYFPISTNKVVGKKRKLKFPYQILIEKALLDKKSLTVNGIYDWLRERYPILDPENDNKMSIQNSIRHNLSVGHRFAKINRVSGSYLWVLNEDANNNFNLKKTSTLQNEEELDCAIRSISKEAQEFYDRETIADRELELNAQRIWNEEKNENSRVKVEKVNQPFSYGRDKNWEPYCKNAFNEMEQIKSGTLITENPNEFSLNSFI